MANLDFTFDEITEKYYDRQLDEIRAYAREVTLPPRVSLEIGSNKGAFLRGMAERHPEKFYLGIEIRKKYADLANRTFEEQGHQNVHVLAVDALLAAPILLDDGQLQELFVFYPDPWWKKKHRKRRVIRTENLDVLSPKFASGGILWCRTDVGPLARDMRAALNAHPDFEPLPMEDYPMQAWPQSERDRLTISKKMPVQLLYYRRK
jgi:tRNA (guanine-N7-)-methyltransferase